MVIPHQESVTLPKSQHVDCAEMTVQLQCERAAMMGPVSGAGCLCPETLDLSGRKRQSAGVYLQLVQQPGRRFPSVILNLYSMIRVIHQGRAWVNSSFSIPEGIALSSAVAPPLWEKTLSSCSSLSSASPACRLLKPHDGAPFHCETWCWSESESVLLPPNSLCVRRSFDPLLRKVI